jgi:hypothetical protein
MYVVTSENAQLKEGQIDVYFSLVTSKAWDRPREWGKDNVPIAITPS